MASSLRASLQPKLLFPSLSIGLVVGIENAVVSLALALMIFSGDLASRVAIGITILFLGGCIHAVIGALGSSHIGMLSGVQDTPAVIMSVIIAAMLAGMPQAGPDARLYTALAALMLTSLFTGLVCLLLGRFKLGGLVSYIPYPVVGGFLAGTGILLVLGALQVMTGKSISLFTLGLLFERQVILQWLAGASCGILMYVLVLKFNHYLVLPGTLAGVIVVFYLALSGSGYSIADATRAGWLVNGLPQGEAIVRFWDPAGFALVDWAAIFRQIGSLLACVAVSLISLLLNTTALELSTGQEIDLNQELRISGWANLAAGAAGSVIGYPMLGDTALAYRLGARVRLNGIFSALVMGLILVVGGRFLGYFPNLMLGGMLFFIGIDFLSVWLYQTWFNMPPQEYAIVVFIALLINTLGFLQGVGIGLGLAVLMFVVQYSRTPTVRRSVTRLSYRSCVERTRLDNLLLQRHGDWLYFLELQGYLFFGSANQILEQIRAYLESQTLECPPRFILLDFRLVSGLDSSAGFSFTKIKRLVQARGIELLITHPKPEIEKRLQKDLPPDCFRYFPDLDHGIEWCENEMLAAIEKDGQPARCDSLFEQLVATLAHPEQVQILQQYLKPRFLNSGELVIVQGSEQCGLYMIESGQVLVQTRLADGTTLRLRALGAGAFFGEIGLYSGQPATADVVTAQPTHLYMMTAGDLLQLEKDAPGVAAALHRFVAVYMSERLAKSTLTIEALR
ncbi:MAG: SulP family inorganic anion transporter [Chloroflexota bacterium]